MGRRSEHSPEGLRALIIQASEEIIANDGLAGLSAREIARAVGYSPGTIYNIFDSLDDLVLQIEGRLLDALDARLAEQPSDGEAKARVLRLAQTYLAFTAERPRLWNLLFEHHLPPATPIPEWYQAKLDVLMRRVETVLEPLAAGEKRAATARAARVLWAGVHGISSLATADKLSTVTAESAQAMVDDLVRNYLAGLEQQGCSRAA
jgi:AcrR family transcriptional regulator